VEVDDERAVLDVEAAGKRVDIRQQRYDDDAADQAEQEIAEADPPRFRRRCHRVHHREQPAAEIGAEHEPERDIERDHVRCRERRGQQHDGETRIREHREQRGDDHVEQRVAGERSGDDLDAGRLSQRLRGGDDQLQRENDETETDQHSPEATVLRVLAPHEQRYADDDEQRREPAQIEREHERHQRGADVGTQHHRERRRCRDQALTGECREHQRRRVAALDQRGDAETGEKRAPARCDAAAQDSPQIAAVEPQNARAHDVRAPDEQRHAGNDVEDRQHRDSGARRRTFTTATSTSSRW